MKRQLLDLSGFEDGYTLGDWKQSGFSVMQGDRVIALANSNYCADAGLNPDCLACAEEEETRQLGVPDNEAAANAKLIAAAPALLNEVKILREALAAAGRWARRGITRNTEATALMASEVGCLINIYEQCTGEKL